MGFFDLPDREPDDDELDVDDQEDSFDGLRPGAWVAGVVPLELVVARSDQAAVVVSRISAYPDGFELTVNSHLRRTVKRTRRHRAYHPMMWHGMAEPGEPLPDELLRFGLAWPDGGRATTLDGWDRSWPDATEPAHGLESHSGSGSDHEYSEEYWAWPLPGPGPLEFVVEWPAFDIVRPPRPLTAGCSSKRPSGPIPSGPRMREGTATSRAEPSCVPLTRLVAMRAARSWTADTKSMLPDITSRRGHRIT